MSGTLTPEQVEVARTGGFTDTYLGRLWNKSHDAIRRARLGVTYKRHPAPADDRRRMSTGKSYYIEAQHE